MDVYNVWALSTCSESNANYWKYKLPRKSQRTNKRWGLLSHPNILHLVRAYYNLSSMVAISVTSSLASTASVKVLFSTFFLVVISSFGHPLQNFLKPKELIILTSSVKLFSTILWKNGKQTIVHPNVYFDPTQTNVLMELKELIILTKSVKLFSIQLLGKKKWKRNLSIQMFILIQQSQMFCWYFNMFSRLFWLVTHSARFRHGF